MKTLKGLLTVVLALSMSTSFAAQAHVTTDQLVTFLTLIGMSSASADERILDNRNIKTKKVSHKELSAEAQDKIDTTINDYCATGNLIVYKQSNVKLAKELRASDRRILTATSATIIGVPVALAGLFSFKSSPFISVAGVAIAVAGGYFRNKFIDNEEKADQLLKEHLEPLCEI